MLTNSPMCHGSKHLTEDTTMQLTDAYKTGKAIKLNQCPAQNFHYLKGH